MKRAEIREYVFKLLYCTEFHENEDLQKQYRLYMENLEQLGEIKEIKEKDKEYIINRVTDIVSRIDDIDKEIDKVAVSWKTDRMAKADLNILRLAYYEMNIDDDIPKPVAVDQAVELAKSTEQMIHHHLLMVFLPKLF